MGKMSDVLQKGGREIKEPSLEGSSLPQEQVAPSPRPGQGRDRVMPPRPMDYAGPRREELERLVSFYSPSSSQGKRIDILRSQLLYPFQGEPPRIIMITSAAPREGRSLLAANLAISFSRGLQQYVMVIDCHLHRPEMHRLLGVPRRPGLADYLEHSAEVPDIIHWTKMDKLSVIPAGSPSQRSSELLGTDRMAELLDELRARYSDRYILLDTPPVQAVDDPAVLARLVEGIIFVVLSGDTDREVVLRGLGRLPADRIIGVVMNDRLQAVSDGTNVATPEGIEEMA